MHILIGALVGAVFAVGMTVVVSLVTGRKPTWKHVALAAIGGAVSGAIATATLGAGGLAGATLGRQVVAFGVGGAVGGGTERAAENAFDGRPLHQGVPGATAMGGATGLVSLGVTRGATALLGRIKPSTAAPATLRSRLVPSSLSPALRRFMEAPTPGSGSGALRVWRDYREKLREREWFGHSRAEAPEVTPPPAPTPGMVSALAF